MKAIKTIVRIVLLISLGVFMSLGVLGYLSGKSNSVQWTNQKIDTDFPYITRAVHMTRAVHTFTAGTNGMDVELGMRKDGVVVWTM